MIDLDAMNKDPWPTWPVDKNELRMLVEEVDQLRAKIQQLNDSTIFINNERSDAICANFDLREENAELREKIDRLRAALDIIAGGNGLQMTWYSTAPMPLERYKENHYEMMQIARAALGGASNDAAP